MTLPALADSPTYAAAAARARRHAITVPVRELAPGDLFWSTAVPACWREVGHAAQDTSGDWHPDGPTVITDAMTGETLRLEPGTHVLVIPADHPAPAQEAPA